MGAGIGGIGMGMGNTGNIGNSNGASATQAAAKDSLDPALSNIQHKKKHGADSTFSALLNTLNKSLDTQKVSDVQSGVTGDTGTRINKYA